MDKEKFVSTLATLRPNATFLSLTNYKNAHNEVACYSIVFHMSYQNALEKSLKILEKVETETDLDKRARTELMEGYQASLDRMAVTAIEEVDDAYTRFFDDEKNYIKGVKMHTQHSELHLYGLVVHKKVIVPGIYPTRGKKRLLTVAKDKLRKLCPVDRFRQFKILPESVEAIRVENLSLLESAVIESNSQVSEDAHNLLQWLKDIT